MLYSYHKASLQAKIIYIKKQQKYTIVILIHEVVDDNPMMDKKKIYKINFFIYKNIEV